ncbi:iron-hydroxamate ABC transporter substrate-binding protein [Bacillus sp. Xin]|uniref:iron-hydroxamate ABC transporter substrate-binding protein n=1 Tax=unclassified Bacillus (in: firmicutes) TaxID=185979 RepID=UPI001573E13B|nr:MULTISPECIES: iron-hydroxamate ABC transporter substrate-binding protein [unclassified Bacillus (in: firmicutes)]MBC6976047.1 iron-hydroxamate ABC transporter substrate-binding protein [Bacillus sp. Xin]NSW38972.1 iron-hydroxamate ABC transporter substrate-binding protein [Bacillus sp. Xin1]
MKKKLTILFSIMCILIISACSQTKSNEGKAEKTTKSNEPKIASMSIHLTNNLLALGITPVGSVVGGDLKDFLPHAKDQLRDTKKLGVVTDPNMESLLQLKPSEIYVDEKYAGEDLAKYEKIAKTHSFNLDEGTWKDHLKQVGKLVNHEKEAEKYIQNYEEQTKRVKGLIDKELGNNEKVMAIRVTAKELRVFSTKRPMGPILFQDLGLQPANGVEKIDGNRPFEVISQEALPDFDADAIFVVVNRDDKAKAAFKQLQETAIWKGLKAVKGKHVYIIHDQPWLDYSALGNKMAMDEAEKMFMK